MIWWTRFVLFLESPWERRRTTLYPLAVIRELVVNAVMHRDYSAEARGRQVQIELYPDRLVVKSPGGLYGGVAPDELGTQDVSSSRHEVLAKLFGDVPLGRPGDPVCENRGSGLPTVMHALRDAGMSPPEFGITPAHVHVSVPQHALLGPEMITWIGLLPARGLTDTQHLALAIMKTNGSVSHEMLRVWGVERQVATQALTDLVSRDPAITSGGRRYAAYRLAEPSMDDGLFSLQAPDIEREQADPVEPELAAVLEAIRAGHVTTRAIGQSLGLNYQAAIRRIRKLIQRGLIEPTASRNSRAQSYRLMR